MSLVDYPCSSEDEAEAVENPPSAPLVLPDPELELKNLSTFMDVERKVKSKKRSLDHGSNSGPRPKVPHGKLAIARHPPDTAGGRLIPPQLLQKRKNIVTEDLDKLFVAKHKAKAPEPKSSS